MLRSALDIRELRFNNPRLAKVGVEVLSLVELRQRLNDVLLSTPQRVDFHHVLLLEKGSMSHMVDFVEYKLNPGALLLMRPGQVQQWRLWRDAEGMVLLIADAALPPASARLDVSVALLSLPEWPTVMELTPSAFSKAQGQLRVLREDLSVFVGLDVEVALIRHELMAMLLRLARELPLHGRDRAATREEALHALFVQELESNYMHRWSVLDYARRLGYSESALARACVTAVGRTAKEIVDRRIVLEAKRLLVHSPMTVVEIGYRLGFTQATNFLKFFKRSEGCTPVEFRRAPH